MTGSVIKHTNIDIRGNYSHSLFSLSVKQSGLISPLAFGKSNVKSRIKNVLKYKKPSLIITKLALIAIVAIVVFLISNAVNHDIPKIYIGTENNQSAEAIMGSYGWDYGSQNVQSDSVNPTEFEYTYENMVLVHSGQQLRLSNQILRNEISSPFTVDGIIIWDIDKNVMKQSQEAAIIINSDLYINAPTKIGEYIVFI